MSRSLISAFFSIALTCSSTLHAEEITLKHNDLTLNANLSLTEESKYKKVFLITHGTLAHNGMDIINTWQELLTDEGISSLAINLSLGLDNRHGMYECSTPHVHKHEDAVKEINAWVDWLKKQGTEAIILGGHSRGGNQTAWYSDLYTDPIIQAQILIAPQTWSKQDELDNYANRYKQPLGPILIQAQQKSAEQMIENTGFIYCENTQVSAGSFTSYYQTNTRFDTPTLLQSSSLPTLVFTGSEDQTVKNLDTEMAKVNNSKVKVMQIEGANHYFRDLYMDEVIEYSLEFIDQL